jgi:hypothetical protein
MLHSNVPAGEAQNPKWISDVIDTNQISPYEKSESLTEM